MALGEARETSALRRQPRGNAEKGEVPPNKEMKLTSVGRRDAPSFQW
jgi:hypothetical protein